MIGFSRYWNWSRLAKTAIVVALTLPIPVVSAIGGDVDGTAETILFVRHGEKPEGGLGQLNLPRFEPSAGTAVGDR
jgi:hypothetical protein